MERARAVKPSAQTLRGNPFEVNDVDDLLQIDLIETMYILSAGH